MHLHYILWRDGAPRFDLRAEQLVQQARRLRKAGLVAAAQVRIVKIDDVMELFARYVSEWNPNKDVCVYFLREMQEEGGRLVCLDCQDTLRSTGSADVGAIAVSFCLRMQLTCAVPTLRGRTVV